jgi:hypothetical protein
VVDFFRFLKTGIEIIPYTLIKRIRILHIRSSKGDHRFVGNVIIRSHRDPVSSENTEI